MRCLKMRRGNNNQKLYSTKYAIINVIVMIPDKNDLLSIKIAFCYRKLIWG